MKTRERKSIDTPIMAAGGIVVKTGRPPLVAIVQRQKDHCWVLPKGKLRSKEGALAAARRGVGRETGYKVVVREFLGIISYESGGRPKIVQFWLMTSLGHDGQELMSDAKAVKWLPLNAAVAALSEPIEQLFLTQIGKQRHDKFEKWLSGKQRPRRPANDRTVENQREERSKTHTRNSNAPNFIRKFFRRLRTPREMSSRHGVF
jgi:ADP-ribose pyrophosphatase YjhB (NUDIX family)